MDLVGIYLLVLVKKSLRKNVSLIDSNTTKTGVYGTMGNKGFFTLTLKCFDSLISFGSGHFEAGQSKNEDRISTLIQLLNKSVNINDVEFTFKDIDFWIILGDLNFRIDLSYEDAISLIKDKKYDVLYNLDKFNTSRENYPFLKEYIKEREINFEPTYKYVKGSNEYAYDEDKVRVPAWTDRIFYCKNKNIKMLTYDTIKSIKYSDHRPVVGTFLVNCENKKNENNYNNNIKIPKENKIDLIYAEKENNNIERKNIISKENNKANYQNKMKNNQQVKMNYRGINFNTEIEINDHNRKYNDKEKQNIYDFFQEKKPPKKNNQNLLFNYN
jgi:inositol-1,4,5-trisphosphate 5-phosphatase